MLAEILVKQIQQSAQSLTAAAKALGDKADWSPLDKGRTAVHQLAECGGIMHMAAQIIDARVLPEFDMAALRAERAKYDTLEKALGLMQSGESALVSALEKTPDDILTTVTVTLPFGLGMTKTLAELALMAYWNNSYHEGQINYISTLV